jgi:hypothetical protein
MRAAELLEQGVPPAEIARRVGVSHQIVSDWRTAWRRGGRDGLRGAGRAAVGLEPGPTVLDVAAGTGVVVCAAARAVGWTVHNCSSQATASAGAVSQSAGRSSTASFHAWRA